jgi:hypothetical protein
VKAPTRVCVESPFHADDPDVFARNIEYAEACMWHSLGLGEAPWLGHLLYPRVLDDHEPRDRELGIAAHCAWLAASELVAVYTDFGITPGMRAALTIAAAARIPVVMRRIGTEPGAWLCGAGTEHFAYERVDIRTGTGS